MRAFLNEPVEPQTGVIECMIRRKKGVMNTIYQAYYEVITWKDDINFVVLLLHVGTSTVMVAAYVLTKGGEPKHSRS